MIARWRLNAQRRAAARRASLSELSTLLSAPLPAPGTSWRDVRFLAVDLETNGLDPNEADVIAIGWAPIEGGRVRPGRGGYAVINTAGEVGQSATVHGLTDTDVARGVAASDGFALLVRALTGAVMIVHHAPLDVAMLNRMSQSVAGAPLPVPVIDTLAMAKTRMQQTGQQPRQDGLRLETLRAHYGLPRYAAHHALGDAIATAELFAAMVAHRFGGDEPALRALWG